MGLYDGCDDAPACPKGKRDVDSCVCQERIETAAGSGQLVVPVMILVGDGRKAHRRDNGRIWLGAFEHCALVISYGGRLGSIVVIEVVRCAFSSRAVSCCLPIHVCSGEEMLCIHSIAEGNSATQMRVGDSVSQRRLLKDGISGRLIACDVESGTAYQKGNWRGFSAVAWVENNLAAGITEISTT